MTKILKCTCGADLDGTLEIIPAIATALFSRGADGKLVIEHLGQTDIDWDEQKTVEREGKIILVCESGCQITEDQLVEEEAPEEEDDKPCVFHIVPGSEHQFWLDAKAGWYAGTIDGDSDGPYDTQAEAEAILATMKEAP